MMKYIDRITRSLKSLLRLKKAYESFKGKDDTKLIEFRNRLDKEAVIIFIHGFGGDAKSTWGEFPRLISEDVKLNGWDIFLQGYNTKLTPDINGIWSSNPNLTSLARFFRSEINNRFKIKYKQIAIVAHSMGGLIVQRAIIDMIQNNEDSSLIHSLTLYGTPSDGLIKAIPGEMFNNQVKDMAVGSTFLKKLREEWSALIGDNPQFKFKTCAGDLDQFVPDVSSLAPFTDNHKDGVNGHHTAIVKPDSNTHSSFLVLRRQIIDKDDFYDGKYDTAETAIQLGDFKRILNKFNSTKENLHGDNLRDYAFALEASGKRNDAINYLEEQSKKGKVNSDVLGILAGRYKRQYFHDYNLAYLDRSKKLYSKAYKISKANGKNEQIYYHTINLAFINLLQNDYSSCKKYALLALDAAENSVDNLWKFATIAEASLYLINSSEKNEYEAKAHYNYVKALELSENLWERNSMHIQWIKAIPILGHLQLRKRLNNLFN